MGLPSSPNNRKEVYLSNIAGQGTALPSEPHTREEEYLDFIAKNGGGGGTGEGDMKKSVYDSTLAVASAGGIDAYVTSAISSKADSSTVNAILDGTDIDSFGDVESALARKMQNYYLEDNIDTITDLETGHTSLHTKTTDTISAGSVAIPTSRGVDGAFTSIVVSEFTVLDNYAVGDYVKHEAKVYKCTTAHSAGAWVAGDFTQVKVLNEVKNKADRDAAFPRDEQAVLGAKNLLKNTASSSDIFTVNADGTVTANGSSSASDVSEIKVAENITFPFDVILSGCPSDGSTTTYRIRANSSGGTLYSDVGEGILIPANTQIASVRCRVEKNQTVSDLVFKPMIRIATDSDPTYAPYAMTNRELTERANVDYSTNEQDTGIKWIDGKPLYRKVVLLSNLVVASGGNTITHRISNLDKTIEIRGAVKRSDTNQWLCIPFQFSSLSSIIYVYDMDTTVFKIGIGSDFGNLFNYANCGFVVIDYTKTTD